MKKSVLLTTLCAGLLALLMTGCNSDRTEKDTDADTLSETQEQAVSACSYTFEDTLIVVGEDFSKALTALGDPVEYVEAASCYYDGMDKVYTYEGFEVRTYPDKDADLVQDICISDASWQTAEGITVGSALEDVIAVYGEDYVLNGKMYRYYFDDTHYRYFFIMDGAVKYFGYAVDASN